MAGSILKYLTCFIILLTPLCSFAADNTLGKHFGVSVPLGAAGESFLHYSYDFGAVGDIAGGTFIGSIPGLIKEIGDSSKGDNYFSGDQMAADVAGAFVGSVIAHFLNNKLQVYIKKKNETTNVSFLFRY